MKVDDTRSFINYAPEACEKLKPPSNAHRLTREIAQAERIGAYCSDGGNAMWMSWWLDRGSEFSSEIAKLGWLYSSFAYGSRTSSFHQGMAAFHDAENFSFPKFFAEMEQRGLGDEVIAKSLLRYYSYAKAFKKWKAVHQESLGADYQELTNAARAEFSAWEKMYAANKEAVDFAFAMEEKVLEGDKRAFQGCSDKARKYAVDFVFKSKPKTQEEILRAAAHPIGSLIVAAAYECERNQGNRLQASVYAQILKEAPTARGPRFATRLGLVAKVGEIKEMKSRFPLDARDFVPDRSKGGFGVASAGYFDTGEGVVKKVSKKGDAVTIEFKKESWKQDVFKCRETRKLDRIDSSGRLIYRKICKKTGTKTVTSQESPITIAASAAHGLKPGAFVVVARSRKDKSEGLPRGVYKSKKKEQLLNFYGLAVK